MMLPDENDRLVIATFALQGLLAGSAGDRAPDPNLAADMAVTYADALLARLATEPEA